MKKINILFPIEAINREFDYKLLLALRVVDKDTNIILAQHDYFNKILSHFQGSVYLGKNMFKSTFPRNTNEGNVDLQYYRELKKNNILVCHLDEEGAVYFGDENYWKIELDMRLNPKVLYTDDYIFTWGEFQREYYKSKVGIVPKENIIATGHPRLDLNKKYFRDHFKNEINKLKERYGNYILINMNMSYANNIFGLKDTFSTRLGYVVEDSELRLHLVKTWAHFNNTVTEFVKLIHSLSIKYQNKSFVIRPHPAEDIDFYKIVFNGVKNVFVDNSGPVNSWILGSDMVIHDGCTTGIEAFLGEIPVINYKPIQSIKYDLWLPNQLGVKCINETEVIEAIEKIESNSEDIKRMNQNSERSKKLIANFDEFIFDEFVIKFKEIIMKKKLENKYEGKISIWQIKFYEYLNDINNVLRYIVRIFMRDKRKRFNALSEAFYGFNDKRILKKIDDVRTDEVKIKIISKRIIIITK
jgi:surface carbohydrate biosynthesis protein